ncbi:MAG: hypothetical protein GY750_06750 [Lentisphaerae bacterium]|nr:hypothetical protein [Lentisphaerota bacterium]
MKLAIKLLLYMVAVAMGIIGVRGLLTGSGPGWLVPCLLLALSALLEVQRRILRKEADQA